VAGNGVAVDALGFLGKPLDEGRGVGDFALGLGQRLALLQGHQATQVVLIGHDQLEPLAQLAGALLGGQRTPGRQGALGGFDGTAGLGAPHLRHATEDFAGRRVVHGDALATVGVQPLPIDIGLLAEQLRVVQVHGISSEPPVAVVTLLFLWASRPFEMSNES